MLKKPLFFLTVPLLVFCLPVKGMTAGNVILLENTQPSVSLSGKIEIAAAEKNTATLDNLLLTEQAQPFRVFEDSRPLPVNPEGYWFRCTFRNTSSSHNDYVLEYNYYRAGTSIEVYIPSADGKFSIKKEAPGLAHTARDLKYRNPVFTFELNFNETKTLYIKLQIEKPVYVHLLIHSVQQLFASSRDDQLFMGFYYGILFVMAFYNFFLFFAFRDKSFLFLSCFIVNLLVLQLNTPGILAEHITALQNFDYYLGKIFMLSTTIFFILFGRSFIETGKHLPAWDKILLLLSAVHTGICIADFLVSGLSLLRNITLVLPVLWLILLAIRLSMQAKARAKYFLLITLILILFGMLTLFQAYIPFLHKIYFLFSDPINTGTIFMVLLFSFYLTKSISNLQKKEIMARKVLELDQAKSRFFANISHEFRTPLTLITGPLEDMLNQPQEKQQQKKINMMLANARRLLNLINQLLDLSMLDSLKLKLQAAKGDVIPFLKSMVENFSCIAGQNQQRLCFTTNLAELELYYDREKLEKIMFNLIINAIKFTPPGGSITLGLKSAPGSGKEFPCGYAEITVMDTGLGIPRGDIGQVFDRFYHGNATGNLAYAGAGIGLSLVKEFMLLHHGTVGMESNTLPGEEQGTCFTLRFPLGRKHLSENEIPRNPHENVFRLDYHLTDFAETEADNETSRIAAACPDDEKEKNIILLVEDNTDVRRYIREDLEAIYTIREAKDGAEGFAIAKQLIPDLIICDVLMPVMDGFEFCNLIKKEFTTSHIPVIFLTAKAAVENMLEGLAAGADDYITKPFNMTLLRARIKNLIDLRGQLQQKIQRQLLLQPSEILHSGMDGEFIKKIQAVIDKNISDFEFNIDVLANSLFMSRATLNRKIRALTGESSNQYIQSYRLHRAAQMLNTETANVTEIAYAVGFSSAAYFTKCFKEKFHQVPSQYQL